MRCVDDVTNLREEEEEEEKAGFLFAAGCCGGETLGVEVKSQLGVSGAQSRTLASGHVWKVKRILKQATTTKKLHCELF